MILDGAADAQHKGGKPRHRDVHAGENALKPRDHKRQQQNHDAGRNDEHGHRIKHRGLDLALDLLRLFGKFRQAFQHHFEHAAQFTGLDHVDEQAVENLRMLRQGLGKRAAALDGERQFAKNSPERGVALLFFEHAQAAQERQARVHQRGQLAGEGRQHLGFHPPAQTGNLDLDVERASLFAAAGPGRRP